MKRIFAIMAAVTLCFVLTVPAFAAEVYYELPEDMGYEDYCIFTYFDSDGLWAVFPVDSKDSVYFDGSKVNFATCEVCFWDPWELAWISEDFFDDFSYGEEYELLYSTFDIYDNDGNIYYESGVKDSSSENIPEGVLSASVSSESLTGALGEVMSMLAVVLPVIAGLFGIRKGIAFLISRIRGV